MKVEKGELKVDVVTLFESLDDRAKRRVARSIAFDEHLVKVVVDWLTKGEVVWDDPAAGAADPDEWDEEAGLPWYIFTTNGTILEEVRMKLLEHHTDLPARVIEDLIKERERLTWEKDQYQKLLWKLHQGWNDNKYPQSNPDFREKPTLTAENVKNLIEAKEKEIAARGEAHA